jgi:hypothetical protein
MAINKREKEIFNSLGGALAVDARAFMALKGGYDRSFYTKQAEAPFLRIERYWLSQRLKSKRELNSAGFINVNYFSKNVKPTINWPWLV